MPVEQELAALEKVEQAAGRGDQHVDAAHDLGFLVAERHAADQQRHVQLVVAAVFDEAFLDLRGEFARRLQDQRARHARAGAPLLEQRQHGQDESGGLAGAGLGDAENVASGERMRDGLRLDGRRGRCSQLASTARRTFSLSPRFGNSCETITRLIAVVCRRRSRSGGMTGSDAFDIGSERRFAKLQFDAPVNGSHSELLAGSKRYRSAR